VIQGLGDDTTVMASRAAAAARQRPGTRTPDYDLVLLDLALGDADGFEVLVELRQPPGPAVPVVVVSASERASDVIRAIDLGAMGFVPKRSSNDALREALGVVMSGGLYVPPMMLGLDRGTAAAATAPPQRSAPLGEHARAEPAQRVDVLEKAGLTPRQTEVLQLLLRGLPNKLIARELNLSVETVKDHVAAVLRALGVNTRTQAVLAVSQMNLQRPPGAGG
jgi:DNA-binding NarL/FixJ family response regulator